MFSFGEGTMGQTGCDHVHTKGAGDEVDLFVS